MATWGDAGALLLLAALLAQLASLRAQDEDGDGDGECLAPRRVGSPRGRGETGRRPLGRGGRGAGGGKGLTAPGAPERRGAQPRQLPPGGAHPRSWEPARSARGQGREDRRGDRQGTGAAGQLRSDRGLGLGLGLRRAVFLREPSRSPRACVGALRPPQLRASLFLAPCPVLSAAFLFSPLHCDLASPAHPAAPFSPGAEETFLQGGLPHFPAGESPRPPPPGTGGCLLGRRQGPAALSPYLSRVFVGTAFFT